MSFIWPWMLITLLLIPAFAGAYIGLLRRRRGAVTDLGPLSVLQNSAGRSPTRQRHVPASLYLFGLTLLLFGLSRPEMFVDLPRVEGTVILAFDVSNSMAADDLEPTRMEAAKAAARTFVENQPPGIRIGVVAFSNGGLIVQTPTNEQGEALTAIERLSPEGGTSLGQGIFSSLNAIAGKPIPADPAAIEAGTLELDTGAYSSSVIMLLTDGENTNAPDPLEIAQLAADAGVRIYPVGIGSAEGTVLQIEGFNVLTQLNEPMLEQIASMTNGTYYRAEDEETLNEIYRNVDLQLTTRGEKTEVTAIFAGAGLLLFLVGGCLSLLWFGRMPL
jgi:Ca-activated chloride channel family protein